MTHDDFDNNVDFRCRQIKKVLQNKAKEYAPGEDRLAGFKEIAKMFGDRYHPLEILLILQAKHTQSILGIVDDIKAGKKVRIDLLNEKIGDHINYDILFENLFYDLDSIVNNETITELVEVPNE